MLQFAAIVAHFWQGIRSMLSLWDIWTGPEGSWRVAVVEWQRQRERTEHEPSPEVPRGQPKNMLKIKFFEHVECSGELKKNDP